ncbi:PTS fructose transporter subunit IIC [Enterococcus sp. BWB1-3]|uniref:PTS fructose transporter subunit IIC n=1 Tax=unclassified Enterococcus TaxID=2608891 RepID=UPI0019229C5B|nr:MULTISPECIES: PTS fructose transporter subunit IIC [unclassified Enterococcus]MBL1230025.1 PTS fructose transporter subunit IIC [Enterococcus sp. BWB1-3]MCB5952413.1 PTS fructose transporter subunit IIC [Enterococcus sp. BWT-B8]
MKGKFAIKKHVMTGISYMIPIIVAGGILGALAKGFGGFDIGDLIEPGATPFTNMNPFTWVGFWWGVNKISSYAMSFAVAVMTAGTSYSIAGRPAIVPGLVLGFVATETKAGFIGGILSAFVIGWFVNWMKKWKVPEWLKGLMPVLLIPTLTSFVCGMLFLIVLSPPLAYIMDKFQLWIISLNGGAKSVIGAVIGAGMGFDLGGPINKTASLAANALGADGIYGPMAAKIVGGMTPAIGAFIATLVAKNKFSQAQKETGKAALPLGLCFITEGCLPFAAADPLRFIFSSMLGSSIAGAIATGMGVESVAGHGGIFVVPMMEKPIWFLIALFVGSLTTGIVYGLIKKSNEQQSESEENEADLDDIDFDITVE